MPAAETLPCPVPSGPLLAGGDGREHPRRCSWRRRWGAVLAAGLLAATTAGCGLTDGGGSDAGARAADTTGEPGDGTDPVATAAGTAVIPGDGAGALSSGSAAGSGPPSGAAPAAWCDGLEARPGGTVAAGDLTELSGLAASQAHPGVLWAHNDSGQAPVLFALSADGSDLGRFPLEGVVAVDIEDIAVAGGAVYLADIGDNDENRDGVALYRVAEPDPADPGPVGGVEMLRLRYPDGPHDAEALVVDPSTGEVAIIVKAFQFAPANSDQLLAPAPATVYVAAPPLTPDGVTELTAAGEVALDQLDARATAVPAPDTAADLGLGGLATGADIRADGRVVAVRTYATVWLFDRPEGSTVAQALAGVPCEAPTRPEPQGEAVAFLAGGDGLVTASEGLHPDLTLITDP